MANDPDFYKRKYQGQWKESNAMEKAVVDRIMRESGNTVQVKYIGFGAGTTKFYSGNAASHGQQENRPDLGIIGTNIEVEVTGPHTKTVDETSGLWIRVKKLNTAREHMSYRDTWCVHMMMISGLMRVVRLDAEFFKALDAGEFEHIGYEQGYWEIPADHAVVQPFDKFVKFVMDAPKVAPRPPKKLKRIWKARDINRDFPV